MNIRPLYDRIVVKRIENDTELLRGLWDRTTELLGVKESETISA